MQQGLICPLMKDSCIENKCAWWVKVTKQNVVTKDLSDESSCAIPLLVDANVALLKQNIGIQSAVENSRNETVQRQDALLTILDQARRPKLATQK